MVARHLFSVSKQWEHTRWIGYTLIAVNSKPTDRPKILDYMPLLTDDHTPQVIEPITTDQMQSLLERDRLIREKLNKS